MDSIGRPAGGQGVTPRLRVGRREDYDALHNNTPGYSRYCKGKARIMAESTSSAGDMTGARACDVSHRLGREMLRSSMRRLAEPPSIPWSGESDPLGVGAIITRMMMQLASNPLALLPAQMALVNDFGAIGRQAFLRALGFETESHVPTPPGDRRFRHEGWSEHTFFDVTRQSYLATGKRVFEALDDIGGLDERSAAKLRFYVGQLVDALSPSNFHATNPEVLERTRESGGANLVDGLNNLLDDLERSGGRFDVATTPADAFEVGGNLATTPGKVVFQNELFQLIQYAPTTETVARRPLLVIPPWMNKYYILDLTEQNSMLRWLVDAGHTVFVMSRVNPDESLAGRDFEDYMRDGILAALDAIELATGEKRVNAVGYCLGGILLSATLAVMAKRGDKRIASATLLTTMVDFSDAGDVQLFIDDEGLESLEARICEQGYLDGAQVGATFRAFRANDLVWSFYVNNYLLGNEPRPFDLLYWNADSTNMPAACHLYIMRNMYLHNRLRQPGELTLDGTPVDVTAVKTPSYVLSTIDDHIAPWKTTYETTGLFSGPVRFVLGASGHIAGVINPPARGKYGYWTQDENPARADDWLAGAKSHAGSWWPDWARWVKRYAGGRVPARAPGEGSLPILEDAPGSYVKVRRTAA